MKLSKRVLMVFIGGSNVRPIGSAFMLRQPNLVMTAAHVIADSDDFFLMDLFNPEPPPVVVREVIYHPTADVALLVIDELPGMEWFPPGLYFPSGDFPLGQEVEAYGFAWIGTERPIPGRLMRGHIQRHVLQNKTGYEYDAYELSFPAFHNLSGAPVFCPTGYPGERTISAIGVITDSVSYSSEQEGLQIYASWSLAASFHPLKEWIVEIGNRFPPECVSVGRLTPLATPPARRYRGACRPR